MQRRKGTGRGTELNPPNRFEQLSIEPIADEGIAEEARPRTSTRYYRDTSRSILAKNDSPDIPFTYSLNPYRGCEHGCIYCYARPSHEYLGFSAGLDFESRIMIKLDAPLLLEKTLCAVRWRPQAVALSGNTDCYQPVERQLKITRRCLEVFLRHRNPVEIITKNALLLRDQDLLQEMARRRLVHVMISVTTLDPELTSIMEPRSSTPAGRLDTVATLASLGVPVGINVSPVIPGLTDEEIPSILQAAAARGASAAACSLLRLPGAVEALFLDWLRRHYPDRAGKITNRIRQTRDGRLSDSRFGVRMRGEGEVARTIFSLFNIGARQCGLPVQWEELNTGAFLRDPGKQSQLFDSPSL